MALLHMAATTPVTTPQGRTVHDVACRCGWATGHYTSLDSARRAGDRHLADTNGAATPVAFTPSSR